MGSYMAAPMCYDCWDKANPGREAVPIDIGEREICSQCGTITSSGIYVRMHKDDMKYGNQDS